ncbi:MAG: FAD-dependent monooxygenase [Gammaproteobacteria bacterium]|nr:FAD-dependent monooxygenase [Gammaproteobacteria bacterium]
MTEQSYDVIVVGAALAGCTAAILYGRAGLKVALIERNPDAAAYKQICTHFIQASATPTLRRLGLADKLDAVGSIHNSVNIWTHFGWMREPALVDDQGAPIFGYNVRRQVLDPLIRELAKTTPGVDLLLGHSVRELVFDQGRVTGVVTSHEGTTKTWRARLVVAADGRNSRLAELAQAPTKFSMNRRSGIIAQYRNVPLKHGTISQMWINDAAVGYIFPNDDGVTVVAAMPPQADFARFKADPEASLAAYINAFPNAPDLRQASLVSDVLQIKDYPNQTRPAVAKGMALVGDAALSMDPLFGVGCGWAFQTAEWLVDATADALKAGQGLDRALSAYAKRRKRQLAGHEFVVTDFSKRYRLNLIESVMFKAAARDPEIAAHVFRFALRITGLGDFLKPQAVLRALWINMTVPAPA